MCSPELKVFVFKMATSFLADVYGDKEFPCRGGERRSENQCRINELPTISQQITEILTLNRETNEKTKSEEERKEMEIRWEDGKKAMRGQVSGWVSGQTGRSVGG